MREILFKAKRIDNGEWVEGSLIQSPYMESIRSWISSAKDKTRLRVISSDYADWRAVEVDTKTICQYTGLTDKNGKKIWENDVVSMKYVDCVNNGVIEYHTENARFVFREFEDVYGANYGFDYTCEMEVIGNIFDNPELLEGGVK